MKTSPRTTVTEDKIPGPSIGEIHILSRTFFSSHKNIDRKQQISEKVIFRFILGSINSGRFLFVLGFNGIIFTEMATLGSAKSNVMKLVIPAVKKCLLPAGRPGDSFVSLMCRSLSIDVARNTGLRAIRRLRMTEKPAGFRKSAAGVSLMFS